MLVPGSDEDYNFGQSSNRMPTECSFGMLVNKWAILWHSLNVKFERRVTLINSYFYLYRFCIDQNMFKEEQLIEKDS